jgi:hypothetical protein
VIETNKKVDHYRLSREFQEIGDRVWLACVHTIPMGIDIESTIANVIDLATPSRPEREATKRSR